jgi:alpha-glucan,water dikinase
MSKKNPKPSNKGFSLFPVRPKNRKFKKPLNKRKSKLSTGASERGYALPPSVTVPFGVFEEVLASPENKGVREKLQELLKEENLSLARKTIVDNLQIPKRLEAALSTKLNEVGTSLPSKGVPWQQALKTVWASKWTDRAVSSRRSMGVLDSQLFLAVLVQPLKGGHYAFVIHTKSPLVGDAPDEALIEVCVGLGESLVSNSPGRALSATVSPRGVKIHSYPSKPVGVFPPSGGSLMFRSDSNGEDLQGFAGAGLYDSVSCVSCPSRPVDYTSEPLVFDEVFRDKLLLQLFEIGRKVETHFDG